MKRAMICALAMSLLAGPNAAVAQVIVLPRPPMPPVPVPPSPLPQTPSAPNQTYSAPLTAAPLAGPAAPTASAPPAVARAQPAPLAAAPAPVTMISLPPPGACSPPSLRECASEAASCLVARGLTQHYAVQWIDNLPRMIRTSPAPTQDQENAHECALDLEQCFARKC